MRQIMLIDDADVAEIIKGNPIEITIGGQTVIIQHEGPRKALSPDAEAPPARRRRRRRAAAGKTTSKKLQRYPCGEPGCSYVGRTPQGIGRHRQATRHVSKPTVAER